MTIGAVDRGLVSAVLALLAVLLLSAGLAILLADRARRRRLRTFAGAFIDSEAEREQAALARPSPNPLQRLNTTLARGEITAGVRRELVRAGSPLQAGQFIYLRALAAGIGGVLLLALGAQVGGLIVLLAPLAGLILGWMVPMMIIRSMQRRRLAAFERHLPDAIDIMAGSLEAGSSLPMALELVAREIPAPVSTEFGRSLRDVGLGMALDDALLNMLDRISSEELDMLATAVAIQYRVGGNLADVLKTIAHTIRERVRIRADVRALTAQQAISANVLAFMPLVLAVLLFVLNPAYERRLFDPGFPQFATFMAAAMVALAYILLKRIVSIDA